VQSAHANRLTTAFCSLPELSLGCSMGLVRPDPAWALDPLGIKVY
jgi:hypothetical protein